MAEPVAACPRGGSQRAPAPSNRWALAGLFAGAVGIAFAPVFVRLSELPPSATAFWRIALSLPFFWALQLRRRTRTEAAARTAGAQHAGPTGTLRDAHPTRLVIAAGLLFAGDLAVWHWSIRYTSVAHATLLANCAPLVVTFGSWLVFGERFGRLFLIGLATALTGVCLLIGRNMEFAGEALWGDALGLLTAVFYGSYLLTVKRLRSQLPALTIMAGAAAVTAPALLVVSLASGEELLAQTFTGWAVLVGLALVSHVAGQGLIAWALAHLPAAFSSVGLLLQPALATLLAWILFAERLDALQGLGAVVVLAGILLARRGSRTRGPLRSGGGAAG